MSLAAYHKKRDFARTPEPSGHRSRRVRAAAGLRFTVQKHAARRLHYDLRLEIGEVMKSWAVPKGPSLDPAVKSLAVEVEDHPLEYADFEGMIPPGQYGSGTVMVWDQGTWQPESDPAKAYQRGKLNFTLEGRKLSGRWLLIRMSGDESGRHNWLLKKRTDASSKAGDEYGILQRQPESVLTGRQIEEIADDADQVWRNGKSQAATAQDRRQRRARRTSHQKTAATQRPITISPADLPGSRRRSTPAFVSPQLATLVRQPPEGEEWLHELKLDGYRMLAVVSEGKVTLLTRNGNDWTDRFPAIAAAVEALATPSALFDGEIVALREDGTTDFQTLQNWMKRGREEVGVYYAFDLIYYDGYDLTPVPLEQRKRLLREVIESRSEPTVGTIRYSDHLRGHGAAMLKQACQHAIEGIISKRADAPYEPGRSASWVKLKCLKRQEFLIGGFTAPGGARTGFGALLLGYYDAAGRLIYAGRVGTGFTEQSLTQLTAELKRRRIADSPFANPPQGSQRRGVTWIAPELVAEVEFGDWTEDGRLRHPSFQGLREDKPPEQITREMPAADTPEQLATVNDGQMNPSHTKRRRGTTRRKQRAAPRSRGTASAAEQVAGVRLSNPDRILYPEQGLTKLDLARFYESIAEWVLPYVTSRPLSLVRCPRGRGEKCFFQKHFNESVPDALRSVEIAEQGQSREYLWIDDLSGLVSLIQIGVLEIHPWPARIDRLERPDMLIFDLDPGEGVAWSGIVAAASDVRDTLSGYGLESLVRLTGGKGLHVVVPLVRRHDWNQVKGFARQVAEEMARRRPDRYTATMSKSKRQCKIYIDYLRNARGATAIASYSTRARAGAPMATPVRWDELSARLAPDRYTVRNLARRLTALHEDPWAEFPTMRQRLPK